MAPEGRLYTCGIGRAHERGMGGKEGWQRAPCRAGGGTLRGWGWVSLLRRRAGSPQVPEDSGVSEDWRRTGRPDLPATE